MWMVQHFLLCLFQNSIGHSCISALCVFLCVGSLTKQDSLEILCSTIWYLPAQMLTHEICPLFKFRFLSVSRFGFRFMISTFVYKTVRLPQKMKKTKITTDNDLLYYLHSSLLAMILSLLEGQRRFSGSSNKPIIKCFLQQRDWYGQTSGSLTNTPQSAVANATSTLEVGSINVKWYAEMFTAVLAVVFPSVTLCAAKT